MTVVPLRPKHGTSNPHITGPARCLACRHEWTVVAPIGTTEFECPSCGTERGVMRYHIAAEDGQKVFRCTPCGSEHFFFVAKEKRTQILCVGCGAEASIDDVFPR